MNKISVVFLILTLIDTVTRASEHGSLIKRTPFSYEAIGEIILSSEHLSDELWEQTLIYNKKLQELDVTLHDLKVPKPTYAPTLKILKLTHGGLQSFPIAQHLASMPSLEELDISYNDLAIIDSPADYSQQNVVVNRTLKKISAQHNKLVYLDMNLINRLVKLEEANFSHNPITTIFMPFTQWGSDPFFSRICTGIDLTHTQIKNTDKCKLEHYKRRLHSSYTKKLCCIPLFIGLAIAKMAYDETYHTIAWKAYENPNANYVYATYFLTYAIAGTLFGFLCTLPCVTACTRKHDKYEDLFIFHFDQNQPRYQFNLKI